MNIRFKQSEYRQNGLPQFSQGTQILFGTLSIIIVGYLGMTGSDIFFGAWPYAALWAAIGWGIWGPCLAAILLLAIMGGIQDIYSGAPLGIWVLVNLLVYSLASLVGQRVRHKSQVMTRFLAPLFCLAGGYIALIGLLMLMSRTDGMSGLTMSSFLLTALLYYPVENFYRLNSKVGDRFG